MTVSSYIFQSPYPQSVQFGRPDPVAEAQTKVQDTTEKTENVTNQGIKEAEQYLQNVTSSPAASINVAGSSTDTGVSASLEGFTALNNQVQALEAYSG